MVGLAALVLAIHVVLVVTVGVAPRLRGGHGLDALRLCAWGALLGASLALRVPSRPLFFAVMTVWLVVSLTVTLREAS